MKRGLFFAAVLAACAPDSSGTIIVHLKTDLPDGSIDEVFLEARSAGLVSRHDSLPWQEDFSFGVLRPGGDDVELFVELRSGGTAMLSATRLLDDFQPGKTTHAWIYLAAEIAVPEDSEPVDAGTPASIDAGTPTSISDAGAPASDAGTQVDPTACPSSASSNRSYVAAFYREISFGRDALFSLPSPSTLETWVRFHANAGHGSTVLFAGDGRPNDWELALESDPPRVVFRYEVDDEQVLDLVCDLTWPEDQWAHLALQIRNTGPRTKVQLFVNGAPCTPAAELDTWPTVQMELFSPSTAGDVSLKLDAVHLRRGAPYSGAFVPAKVPIADGTTFGLWPMDEADGSLWARDAMCNHHGKVDLLSFSDDFPM